jgi:glycosyltransferase involved in cell wall biosynthesis
MKILIIRPLIEKGGASRVITNLVRGLKQQGIDVFIASSGGEWLPLLEGIVPCYRIPLYPSSLTNVTCSILRLSKIVKKEKIDILNSHHRFSGIVCNLYAYFRKIQVISTVHEIKNDKAFLSRLTIGKSAIVYSQMVKHHLEEVCGLHPERIFLVPMGISIQKPELDTITQVRASLGLVENLPVVTCIARLSEEKGCATYIQAIAKVVEAGYQGQFILVGDGPLRKNLIKLTYNLNIDKYVTITGWREDVYSIMAISDFLVLPSLSEAIGITILEGFYFDKPTIASRVGGIPEIVQDGKNGFLVPPGEPSTLAQAIIKLIESPQLARQLGQAGKQLLLEAYTPQAMVNNTINAYQVLSRLS